MHKTKISDCKQKRHIKNIPIMDFTGDINLMTIIIKHEKTLLWRWNKFNSFIERLFFFRNFSPFFFNSFSVFVRRRRNFIGDCIACLVKNVGKRIRKGASHYNMKMKWNTHLNDKIYTTRKKKEEIRRKTREICMW